MELVRIEEDYFEIPLSITGTERVQLWSLLWAQIKREGAGRWCISQTNSSWDSVLTRKGILLLNRSSGLFRALTGALELLMLVHPFAHLSDAHFLVWFKFV